MGDLLGAPDAGAVHTGDNDGEGVARHALPHGVVAGLEVRVEGDLERGLLAAAGLVADSNGVELRPAVEALGLLVLVDGELGIALDQREVRVAGLGVVLDAEGQEWRARRGAQVEDGLVVMRVEAPAAAGRERRVLDPEFEPAVGSDRGDEVGVDGWREPLDLLEGSAWTTKVVRIMRVSDAPLEFQPHARPRCRSGSSGHPYGDCTP
jgi:hypothetical protein